MPGGHHGIAAVPAAEAIGARRCAGRVGLAITMVMAGVIASLGVGRARKRWSGFGALARRAPYASSALMLAIAISMAVSGWLDLIERGA